MTELHIQAASPLITLSPSSPSFNSYSSANLAEIAARVVQEFSEEDINNSNIYSWEQEQEEEEQENKYCREVNERNGDSYNQNDDEYEFEFTFVAHEEMNSSPVSADEIFLNGQIRPIYYPIFNKELSNSGVENSVAKSSGRRLPLQKLFSEERESATTSSSSSEADELDNVQAGTYCVWTPKNAVAEKAEVEERSPGRCKKSSSTGTSSKRWKFRDFLYRSNSDGKDVFVFLTPNNNNNSNSNNSKSNNNNKENYKAVKGKQGNGSVVEEHFMRSKALKQGDKRRSFLPYRQDLVGFFSNVNGLSKTMHPV